MDWFDIKWKIQDISERVGNFVSGGHLDRKKSESIVRGAEAREDEAKKRVEKARVDMRTALEALGQLKAEVLATSAHDFIALVEVLAPVKRRELQTDVRNLQVDQVLHQVVELKAVSAQFGTMALGGAGGAVGGAALAAGAYGLAGIIGTASTGTAIGTLSGAVATNATLAWLGGGALSAGGLGVTGGAAVLGGIAVIPAALLVMYLGQNKAKQKLDAAREFRDQVEALEAQANTVAAQADRIREGAELMMETLSGLSAVLRIQTKKMLTALKVTAKEALALQDALELPLLADAGILSKECLEYIEAKRETDAAVQGGGDVTVSPPTPIAGEDAPRTFVGTLANLLGAGRLDREAARQMRAQGIAALGVADAKLLAAELEASATLDDFQSYKAQVYTQKVEEFSRAYQFVGQSRRKGYIASPDSIVRGSMLKGPKPPPPSSGRKSMALGACMGGFLGAALGYGLLVAGVLSPAFAAVILGALVAVPGIALAMRLGVVEASRQRITACQFVANAQQYLLAVEIQCHELGKVEAGVLAMRRVIGDLVSTLSRVVERVLDPVLVDSFNACDLLMSILDTPLLDGEGGFLDEVVEKLNHHRAAVGGIQKKLGA